jgi:phage tail protein X
MHLNHITTDGERWDSLAHKYYGDVTEMARLIAANPHIPIVETLPGGLTVAIPIIDAANDIDSDLPAWKR